MLLTVKRALQYRQLNEMIHNNNLVSPNTLHPNVNWKNPLPQRQEVVEYILENLKPIPVEDADDLYAIGREFIIFKAFYDNRVEWIVYPRSGNYSSPEQFKNAFEEQGMAMLQFLVESKFNTLKEAIDFILNLYR